MAEKHWRSVQSPFFSGKWISKWPWGGVQRYTFQWRMLRSKKLMWKHMLVRIWRKRNILPFLVGLQSAMATLETNMEFLRNFQIDLPEGQGPTLLVHGLLLRFHLMAYYSDFLIGLWLCSCLSDSQAVLCSYTLFWGTSSHWDLFIPSNPSKLGDF